LSAKILGAFVPGACLTLGTFAVYLAGTALVASPGVYRALLTPASLAVMFLVGPLASLLALQMAVCVSSRVNDARSAQQIGALVILPIAGLLIAQVVGSIVLTAWLALGIAAALAVLNVFVLRIAVVLFDRESILTRWK